LIALACAAGFGLAGGAGVAVAARALAGAVPFADGPRTVRPPTAVLVGCAAIAGAAFGLHAEPLRAALFAALLVAALIGCCWSDLAFGLVPDVLTLVPLLVVAIAALATHDARPLVAMTFVGVPLGLVAFVSGGRGFGWGDVKLLALAAAIVGIGASLVAAAVASFVAAAVALGRGRSREPIAFVPYLAATLAIALALPLGGRP